METILEREPLKKTWKPMDDAKKVRQDLAKLEKDCRDSVVEREE